MIVTEETIAQNPELVQQLVDAHIAATEYENENPDAWLDLAASFGTGPRSARVLRGQHRAVLDIDEQYNPEL